MNVYKKSKATKNDSRKTLGVMLMAHCWQSHALTYKDKYIISQEPCGIQLLEMPWNILPNTADCYGCCWQSHELADNDKYMISLLLPGPSFEKIATMKDQHSKTKF